jgi:mRNA-degrading endonuclease RelE of RelBE toxin-antitoxin system
MPNVNLTAKAKEQFDELPARIQSRVARLRKRLENWPLVSGVKALSGNLAGWFRMRTGDYRMRFYIDGKDVVVDLIGHRKDFYED